MKEVKIEISELEQVMSFLTGQPKDTVLELINSTTHIKTGLRNIQKGIKELELKGKKAKVKECTNWIYAGHTLEIESVYILHDGRYKGHEKGSMDLRLNLVGTKFENQPNGSRRISTVINTKDLIILD